MKTFKIYAQRIIVEVMEVQAHNETEAKQVALESNDWQSEFDLSFEITSLEIVGVAQ